MALLLWLLMIQKMLDTGCNSIGSITSPTGIKSANAQQPGCEPSSGFGTEICSSVISPEAHEILTLYTKP